MESNHYPSRFSSTPIAKLPVELISHIFVLTTHTPSEAQEDDPAGYRPSFNLDSVTTPITLSSVSRHWRSIALSTPALWTSLCVSIADIEPPQEESHDFVGASTCIKKTGVLNTAPLTSYLALSRNYPLDIFIDARDEDWDYTEDEIPREFDDFNTYTHPFASSHMKSIISLLLPHISRWRTLSILTDTWSPMYVAIVLLNLHFGSVGAPQLESLALMRCNEYISYASEFQPSHMREPAFLDFGSATSTTTYPNQFPRLRSLRLTGVHAHWSSLPYLLPETSTEFATGLQTLELAHHAENVRPTLAEFRLLLGACPGLKRLVIEGSGPKVPEDADTDSEYIALLQQYPISLLELDEIIIGYRSAEQDGCRILRQLHAPNVRTMSLEDATHAADPDDEDAGCLLDYVGSGQICDASERSDALDFRLPFPSLEDVTLKGVKACPRPFYSFFNAISKLKRLELVNMTMSIFHALLPNKTIADIETKSQVNPYSCPCPGLESLCLRNFKSGHLQTQDYYILVRSLTTERGRQGACSLGTVDIHFDCGLEDAGVDVVRIESGPEIKVVRRPVLAYEEEQTEMDWDEDQAFTPGGAFNDAAFDAYYGNRLIFSQ